MKKALILASFVAGVALSVGFDSVVTSKSEPGRPVRMVDQGAEWTAVRRNDYYTKGQGVQNIPASWLTALHGTDGRPFLHDKLERYGFLPIEGRELPLGLALERDRNSAVLYAGFTCSACHTRQLEVGTEKYRIDGGPSLTNFEHYTKDLIAAVDATVTDPRKFDRFLDRATRASAANREPPEARDRKALRESVLAWLSLNKEFYALSIPGKDTWGVGRMDALGQIANRFAAIAISPTPGALIKGNIKPAERPVRFPFMWNVAKQDYTQWRGSHTNGNDMEALGRNVVQVMGVGVDYGPVPDASKPNGVDYLKRNTTDFEALDSIESLIARIGPPKWPWGVNQNLLQEGARLYAANCGSCHAVKPGQPRPPVNDTWATPIVNVGTDPSYYDNLNHPVEPGLMNSLYPAKVNVFKMISDYSKNMLMQYRPGIRFIEPTQPYEPGAYESRVLQGIWAAAPYLHNGSVPTLEDLLKPAAERPVSFLMGVRYDTARVGLSADQPARTGYAYDTRVKGNGNAGHEYGADLNPRQKSALLEYLKTL